MENIILEAKTLIDKINSRGGIVDKTEKRRLVELHNAICEGKISYNPGCLTCIKKSYSRLDDYFKANPIKEVKPKAKKGTDEKPKELPTKEGGNESPTSKKTRKRRKSSSESDESTK